MDYLIIIQALWIIIPAYIANGFALVFGGGKPIDFNKNLKDGKRILGPFLATVRYFSGKYYLSNHFRCIPHKNQGGLFAESRYAYKNTDLAGKHILHAGKCCNNAFI